MALVGVDNGQGAGDGFAEVVSVGKLLVSYLRNWWTMSLVYAEEGVIAGRARTYILVNFDDAPPAIFCTRN